MRRALFAPATGPSDIDGAADFMRLHDMGALGDGIAQAAAGPRELRDFLGTL